METDHEVVQREVDDQYSSPKARVDRRFRRRKRKRLDCTETRRFDQFEEDCLQLERELDDLQRDFEEDYRRKHWFSGVCILVTDPIHSVNPDSRTIAQLQLKTLMLEASYAGADEAENVFDKVTHIIVYRKKGQEIPEKNIFRSLGGQCEEDFVRFSQFLSSRGKVRVVYHDWLQACLKAKQVLPVDDYAAVA